MNKFKNIYAVLLLLIITSLTQAQQYKMYNGDTINKIDAANMRHGKWKVFGDMVEDKRYKPTQLVEEGSYVNNKKQGLWLKYFPSGKVHTQINYANNKPNGEYKIYYENGQLEEQGEWKNSRNVGGFKRFYENGKPHQEFVFNPTGKRDGTQKYYYENGQLNIVGMIKEGKELGEFKEYYEDGTLKSIKYYDEAGVLNAEKSKSYDSKQPVKQEPEVVDPKKVAVVEKGAEQNEADAKKNPFNGFGTHTLYNANKQISQKGTFKDYKLVDGFYYRYDENGMLKNIERYKSGKYVGDAPMEEAEKK